MVRAIESGLDDNLRIEGPAYLLAVKLDDAGTAWQPPKTGFGRSLQAATDRRSNPSL